MDAHEAKNAFRELALNRRAELTPEMRLAVTMAAGDRLLRLLDSQGVIDMSDWKVYCDELDAHRVAAPRRRRPQPLVVLTYATHGHEFPAEPVLDLVRRVSASFGGPAIDEVYPRVSGPTELTFHRCQRTDLIRGYRGIYEPPAEAPAVDPSTIRLALVPGVAFDQRAMRLGYGMGFYDRALARMCSALKVGLSFDETLFDAVPCEPHDYPLDAVVTPTRTVESINR